MSKPQRSVDRQDSTSSLLRSIRGDASALSFSPRGVVRCVGFPTFRTRVARDLACLLDVDPSVISWACLPMVLSHRTRLHVPDIAVTRETGVSLVDAIPSLRNRAHPEWVREEAQSLGYIDERRGAAPVACRILSKLIGTQQSRAFHTDSLLTTPKFKQNWRC